MLSRIPIVGFLIINLLFTNSVRIVASEGIVAVPWQKSYVYYDKEHMNLSYMSVYRINGKIHIKMDELASFIKNIDYKDEADYLELTVSDFAIRKSVSDRRLIDNPEYQAVQRKVLLNGLEEYTVTAYDISGSYYYKLTDIAAITQSFSVTYVKMADTIFIHNYLDMDDYAPGIERITLISSPTWGSEGEMITYEWAVYASGEVIQKQTNDFKELLSEQHFNIGVDNAGRLIDCFYENEFFKWPDDLSSLTEDGGFVYFEVVTENGCFKKGGINPDSEAFVTCEKLLREILARQ